jgi:hypothetical protein
MVSRAPPVRATVWRAARGGVHVAYPGRISLMAVAPLRVLAISALVWCCALAASAQEPAAKPPATTAAPSSAAFSEAQLEQMVAPIALYPDSLVAQILMGSTYPLEIVQAARWLEKNPEVEGDALLSALKDQDWDTNVKALCGFRTVIERMNQNLDWTRDLGDAFLAQRTELMDAVQRMRNKAYDAGNLKTTEQQVVTRQPDKIIVIESANPEVVYVPTYSPTVVYAGWSYPYWYYPPMYVAPPYGYGMLAFGAGVAWGAWLSGGCGWGWGSSDIDIDIDRNVDFDRNTNRDRERATQRDRGGDRSGGKGKFQHNPSHRGGVNYRDNMTAQQFGAREGSNRVSRDQARGFDRGGRGGAGATTRPAGVGGGRQTATTRGAGSGGLGSQRAAASGQRANRSSAASSRGSVYSGSRNSGFDRASSSRGGMSRSGGMSRGGGGGRGGGGRRR